MFRRHADGMPRVKLQDRTSDTPQARVSVHQFITKLSRRKTEPRASGLLLAPVERWIPSF